MQALWLEGQRLDFRQDVPIPIPEADEALIQVILAGICNTDLELLRGYYPFSGIPGHEFVGHVVRAPGEQQLINKRVVGEINIACRECEMCKSGLTRHCEHRKTLGIHDWNGVFADYLILPLVNLHVIPEQLSDEAAVFTEPLAAAGEILEQTEILPKDRVLVIGAGKLGQLVAMILAGTGCDLEVLARHPKQQELLKDHSIRIITENKIAKRGYDVIIEATGSPDGFILAMKAIRPCGRIILKSTYKGKPPVNLADLVVNEITVIGSRCGSFETALKLLSSRVVDPRPLIEATFALEHGLAAFEYASRPGVLKVLLRPSNNA